MSFVGAWILKLLMKALESLMLGKLADIAVIALKTVHQSAAVSFKYN
jgi:hypothetical protein